jgi:hypothetical protein
VSVPAASAASAGSSDRGIARYAAVLCLFAVAAAVVSFVKGGWFGWLGIVWVLLAGLSSNMAWYYGRRARRLQYGRHQPRRRQRGNRRHQHYGCGVKATSGSPCQKRK